MMSHSCSSANDSLACLRALDIETLSTANINIITGAFFGTFVFSPVIDGSFITQRPSVALKEGKINGVSALECLICTYLLVFSQNAYLAVTNTNEGIIFVNETGVTNTSIYAGELFPKFGLIQEAQVAKQYAGVGTTLEQIVAIMGDCRFLPCYQKYLS